MCGLFWLWASTRPLVDELEEDEEDASALEPEDVTAAEQPALARR
jgi:hypothetical protein